jgi:protein-disulfide isomerase
MTHDAPPIKRFQFADVLAVTSVLCAITVTGIVLVRHFRPNAASLSQIAMSAPERVADWELISSVGESRGATAPVVTIVEFADFECPYCKRFAEGVLDEALAKYPDKVKHVFRHWPLPSHRFAYPSARAVLCAREQGRFWEMHHELYGLQDSLGLVSFPDIAGRAGVPDLEQFGICSRTPGSIPEVEADVQLVQNIGGTGTPTIIINGWRFKGIPPIGVIDSIVAAAH